jgi:hypothetical protein
MLRADITISGDNIDTTQKLAKTVFPNDAEPQVKQLKEENIEEMQPFKKARLQ